MNIHARESGMIRYVSRLIAIRSRAFKESIRARFLLSRGNRDVSGYVVWPCGARTYGVAGPDKRILLKRNDVARRRAHAKSRFGISVSIFFPHCGESTLNARKLKTDAQVDAKFGRNFGATPFRSSTRNAIPGASEESERNDRRRISHSLNFRPNR